MIRLFVGIELPEDVKDQIYALRGGVPNALWVARDNLHMTLRFIGNVDEHEADDIHSSLMKIQASGFSLAMTQVGYFANGGQMRHLWAGVSNYNSLDFLHDKIDSVLMRHHLKTDKHKFHAHATIAKLRGTPEDEVFKFLSYHNLFRSDEFYVDHFTLFSSHPRHDGDGSFFQAEAEYPLYPPYY